MVLFAERAVIEGQNSSLSGAVTGGLSPVGPSQPTSSGTTYSITIVGPYEQGPLPVGQRPSYTGYGWPFIGKIPGGNYSIPALSNIGWSA